LGSTAGGAGAAGFSSAAGATGFAATGSTGAGGSGVSTLGAAGGAALRTASAGIAADAGGFDAMAGGAAIGALGFSATAGGAAVFGTAVPGFAGAATEAGGADFAIAGVSPGFLMALSTSPGLEIFEKSNFGLGASDFDAERDSLAEAPLPCRNNLRTRSASSSSTELECVFFSVTPTFGRASRISLLFTSSSLARSLMRTFDIRVGFSFLVSGFSLLNTVTTVFFL